MLSRCPYLDPKNKGDTVPSPASLSKHYQNCRLMCLICPNNAFFIELKSVCCGKQAHNRLVCHCNHTYGDLIFVQVCSEPTEMHCNAGLGKCTSHCSVLLGKTGTQQGCVSLQSHLWRFDLRTGMQ